MNLTIALTDRGRGHSATQVLRPESRTMSLNLEILHAAAAAAKKSQADIAREMGISKATVSRWFSGKGEPETVERLRQLAAVLETSLAAMVGEDAAINERERLLLKIYREQDPTQAEALLAMLAAFSNRPPS